MSRPAIEPWLGHLPRDRRGLPVPYVNLWGQQTIANTRVAYDPNVYQMATFVDEDRTDAPNFLKQCPQRQRECMWKGMCQVCGRPVPWSRRFLVVAPISVETIEVQGHRRAAVFEPWLDQRCADIALNWCPALIRRTREEQLTLVPIRSQRDVQMALSTGWLEGPLEAATKANYVAMTIKLILLSFDIEVGQQETPS